MLECHYVIVIVGEFGASGFFSCGSLYKSGLDWIYWSVWAWLDGMGHNFVVLLVFGNRAL